MASVDHEYTQRVDPSLIGVFDGRQARNYLNTNIDWFVSALRFDITHYQPDYWIMPYAILIELQYLNELNRAQTDYSNQKITETGVPPEKLLKTFVKSETQFRSSPVWVVDGELVRQYINPYFSFGGHHLVYPWVPDGVLIIDQKVDVRERSFVLLHEWVEFSKIQGRVGQYPQAYDIAHEYAVAAEMHARRLHGASYPGDKQYSWDGLTNAQVREKLVRATFKLDEKTLPVPHYEQTGHGTCGPAALRMQLASLGVRLPEKTLARWADIDIAEGVEEENLIETAQKLGLYVATKKHSSRKDLFYFVQQGLCPICNVFDYVPSPPKEDNYEENDDEGDDHYQTAVGINHGYVVVNDSQFPIPKRIIPLREFEDHWYGLVGRIKPYNISRGWLMVTTRTPVHFDLDGVQYYKPTA